ncbi:MAG: hypothetical protein IJU70_04125 [Lentisphaeria bacterium]|nr:hypothetical protein [Lentisphaeria bacterium]
MKKMGYCIAVLAGVGFFTLGADDFTFSSPADWEKTADICTSAPGKMQVRLAGRMLSAKKCTFEPGKSYYITGAVRAASGSVPGNILLGLRIYDSAGEHIPMHCIYYVEGSITELLEATEPTDKTIVVKDASKWKTAAHMVLAFNAKDDFSDLPNRNIVEIPPSKIEKADGKWIIHFSKPLGTVLQAGTKIREHYRGGEFYFGAGSDKKPVVKKNERLWLRKGVAQAQLLIHAAPSRKGEKMLLELDDFSIYSKK